MSGDSMATSCEGCKAAIERENPGYTDITRHLPHILASRAPGTDEVPGGNEVDPQRWPWIRLLPLATSSNFEEQYPYLGIRL